MLISDQHQDRPCPFPLRSTAPHPVCWRQVSRQQAEDVKLRCLCVELLNAEIAVKDILGQGCFSCRAESELRDTALLAEHGRTSAERCVLARDIEWLESEISRAVAVAEARLSSAHASWQVERGAIHQQLGEEEASAAQRLSEARGMWRTESEEELNKQLSLVEAQLRGDVTRCKAQAAMLEETMQQQQQATSPPPP